MNPADRAAAPTHPREQELLAAAWQVRSGSLCTFSGFAVGAAMLDGDGKIWTGANVENASYTLGLCAERVALFYALTHAARDIECIVVVTEASSATSPCGACRQVLFEFAPDAIFVSATHEGKVLRTTVRALLPAGFDASALR